MLALNRTGALPVSYIPGDGAGPGAVMRPRTLPMILRVRRPEFGAGSAICGALSGVHRFADWRRAD